jgi:hypothetical protein
MYIALAYKNQAVFGSPLQPVFITVVTYTPQGEIIDRLNVACLCSATEAKVFDYQDRTMMVHDGTPKFNKPLTETNAHETALVGHTRTGSRSYSFTPEGRIMRVSQTQ